MSAAFSCREAVRLANEALDHPLSLGRRLELGFHMTLCGACRAYRRQVSTLERLVRGHAMRESTDGEGLTPEARERIRQAMRGR